MTYAGAVRAGADDDGVQVFRGNLTAPDHFHHLYVERTSLLVGARSATQVNFQRFLLRI